MGPENKLPTILNSIRTAPSAGYVKDAPHTTDCVYCEERINQGELAVIAPKFRDQMIWHPRCFQCSACEELLVDLTYCVHDDKIYCERHYAEMLKPRCNACDEVSEQHRRMRSYVSRYCKKTRIQTNHRGAEARKARTVC